MEKIKAFDIDGTFKKGNISIELFFRFLPEYPELLKEIPKYGYDVSTYTLNIKDLAQSTKSPCIWLPKITRIEEIVNKYYDYVFKKNKINPYNLKYTRGIDVGITTTPEPFLQPLKEYLGIDIIGTQISLETGELISPQIRLETGELIRPICYGINKYKLFKEKYPNKEIIEYYTDSKKEAKALNTYIKKIYVKKGKTFSLYSPVK